RTASVDFTVNKTGGILNGKIQVEDKGLQYDNRFYFNIHPTEKIKVIALSEGESNYLNRIFDAENFDFTLFEKGEFDYNQIASAQTVILNELEEIPSALVPILIKLVKEGAHLLLVPSGKSDLNSYNLLLQNLRAPTFSNLKNEA